MMKKVLIILSLLFVLAIALMPFALSSCGMNGFHISVGSAASACGSHLNFTHLSFMRAVLTLGLVVSIVVLAAYPAFYRIFSFTSHKESFKFCKEKLSSLRQKFISSLFKPFDQLALAYSSGLVQPKLFSQVL